MKPAAAFVEQLDPQSRQTLAAFAIQISIGIALMLVLAVAGLQSWEQLGAMAVRVFTFYSLADSVRAMIRRQVPWAGSLNLWDQALAFSGCAFLLHAMLSWPG